MGTVAAELLANRVLWAALLAWFLAQIIKLPLNYMMHHEWDWGLLLSAGGMPSSHSALVTARLWPWACRKGSTRRRSPWPSWWR